MLGHEVFQFNTLRKYVVLFGTIFNDITIKRYDSSDNLVHALRVPIMYGAREKLLARVEGDPALFPGRPQAITLPRMSFEITGMHYDPSRQLPGTQWIAVADPDHNNTLKHQYVPVPYNIGIRLAIAAKNTLDGTKIIEQILAFFRPDWTATVELIEQTGKLYDIPVCFDGQPQQDEFYEGSFEQRRAIVWTLPFTIKGYLFGPVIDKKIIKFTTVNLIAGEQSENNSPMSTLTTYPGMLANGSPTTSANDTVQWSQININDDYGFVEERSGIEIFE